MSDATSQSATPENMSFEQSLAELETIVQNLESGKAPLEESIKAYERGITLKNHCEKKLNEAKEKIEKITLKPDGSIGAENFNPE